MCGISGLVGNNWNKSNLESMVNVLNHRGPDDSGCFINKDATVGLGHNRLSIIDLSKSGHQPMSNKHKSFWITFNGEIYNYIELKKQLKGYPFRTKTDTEVIIAAYEKWGENCVKYFNGMFSFAIWDDKEKTLFCARDRVGIKPFFYSNSNEKFIFASEIKAILAAGHIAKPNWSTWSNYLVKGIYDYSDESFFEGIYSLKAGHTLILKRKKIKIKKYWDINSTKEVKSDYDLDKESNFFISLLKDSLKLRLRSDVKVGMNLSGGLDSSSLMVVLDEIQQKSKNITAFTATFNNKEYDEDRFSKQVKTNLNWNINKSISNKHELWESIEEVLWHQEAPFGGVGTIAYHNLHKLSKKMNVKVLLEGQGVDEMLAGYAYYLKDSNDSKKNTSPLYQDGTKFLAPECINDEVTKLAQTNFSFRKPFNSSLSNDLYKDFKYTKLPRVLRMNDRLSMASSRELREPYLDHRIVEYLFSLPKDLKIYNGHTKYLLRKAMEGKLPDSIRLAKKRGVVNPQREWFKNELKEPILDLLSSSSFSQRGIFNKKEVLKTYNNYCNGEGNNSFFIWQWINTEQWFRLFV